MTVMNLGNIDLKLMDTIKIPWDFKKIKLPNKPLKKKSGLRKSSSFANLQRPQSSGSRVFVRVADYARPGRRSSRYRSNADVKSSR